MAFSVGDEVVVVATQRDLAKYNCSEKIRSGGSYLIRASNREGYSLTDVGMCSWVSKSFVEATNQYTDDDWV